VKMPVDEFTKHPVVREAIKRLGRWLLKKLRKKVG